MSVFVHESRPCFLEYIVECDEEWRTQKAQVHGWIERQPISIEISTESAERWTVNGKGQPSVDGCVDLDLNFSPSTNLLPIRRLHLAIGQEASVRAAWLRFPDFVLTPLQQRYRRIGSTSYGYESGGGSFTADLEVNDAGLVMSYPPFFQVEAFGT